MPTKRNLNPLRTEEISEWIDPSMFPPILTPDQAASMLQVSRHTIYRWSSEGRYKQAIRRGKPLRILRDRLLKAYFQGE